MACKRGAGWRIACRHAATGRDPQRRQHHVPKRGHRADSCSWQNAMAGGGGAVTFSPRARAYTVLHLAAARAWQSYRRCSCRRKEFKQSHGPAHEPILQTHGEPADEPLNASTRPNPIAWKRARVVLPRLQDQADEGSGVLLCWHSACNPWPHRLLQQRQPVIHHGLQQHKTGIGEPATLRLEFDKIDHS